MKNITILIPIHKLDDDYSQMLDNFMSSINDFHNDVKLMIICPKDIKTKLEKMTLSQVMEIKLVLNNGSTDFCNQINLGIEKCDTEWFSIGEIDDVYKPIWLSSMNEYIKEYSDVSVFLPIVRDVNVEGKFVSFTNESAWAYGFTEKQGFIDNEVLLDFQNYQTSGGLFKTESIKEMGMIKDNIKLTFSYELFLRLTHNGIKIMTVPRIGYQHVNFREDSLFWSYKNDDKKKLTETEVKFWLDTAKKEFFFKNKREINYEQL